MPSCSVRSSRRRSTWTNCKQRLDRDDYRRVKESLEEVGFGSTKRDLGKEADGPGVAVDLLATYAGQAPHLQEWGRDAQINTDRTCVCNIWLGCG